MDRIFLDTSFLIGFINSDDKHHETSRNLMKNFESPIISDYVFMETLNVLYSRTDHHTAKNFGEYLLKSQVDVVKTNNTIFEESFNLFNQNDNSFTDASIVATMNALGIEKLATFDEDFQNYSIDLVPEK